MAAIVGPMKQFAVYCDGTMKSEKDKCNDNRVPCPRLRERRRGDDRRPRDSDMTACGDELGRKFILPYFDAAPTSHDWWALRMNF